MEALKEKIEADRGKDAFPAAGQKLIYAGEQEDLQRTKHSEISFSYTKAPEYAHITHIVFISCSPFKIIAQGVYLIVTIAAVLRIHRCEINLTMG